MDLLILFFLLAVGISFLCSILESVLLSINMPFVSILEREKPQIGALLRDHKENINKSIASVLILNTVANTLGAAAVGAQAENVYGHEAVFYVSAILTFAILFFSEIIPKTIGAVYWKQLAPMAAYIIRFFIWITYPVILLTLFVTDRIKKDADKTGLSKEELLESAWMSEDEGVLREQESEVIENILQLDRIKVEEILTPRTVIYALDGTRTLRDIIDNEEAIYKFSRIPIFEGSIENITGLVMTKKIFKHAHRDDTQTLNDIQKKIFKISENIPVSKALDLFIKRKDHMFLVVDSYDQTEGILTLEDCVETILGVEIVDESDSDVDMREVAKQKMRLKRRLEEVENRNGNK
ncbi:CNNM domain-containing protein [Sulfurovum sp. zt1-1]|uniref:CNNM domain-containing protein n=1 Tax=Sulfurovum zhangzhouensis TaxID=3019067 RepID=A0ABT7QV58_9BACT|nr:CNNM domain-containing protein [Sulfurovum zhangzhouensis]MDM5270673.1 CNNM domain-containing protein [Sulfurovum zhangzhouensis]